MKIDISIVNKIIGIAIITSMAVAKKINFEL